MSGFYKKYSLNGESTVSGNVSSSTGNLSSFASGPNSNYLSTQDIGLKDQVESLLKQIKIMNFHLSKITDLDGLEEYDFD